MSDSHEQPTNRRRVTPSLERMVDILEELRHRAGKLGGHQVRNTERMHLLLAELACDPRTEVSREATALDTLLLADEADAMELYERIEALIVLCKKND